MNERVSRPRGRPRGFDPDAVLDRVIPVFWARGYEGASMEDLTAAAGLARPSLYAAFGDKRGLFLAALDRYAATLGRGPVDALAGAEAPDSGIRAFLDAPVDLAAGRMAVSSLARRRTRRSAMRACASAWRRR